MMKIIYNNIIPSRRFLAMMFFGFIFARKSAKPLSLRAVNHEEIHNAQAKECGGYVFFYLIYLYLWAGYGYRNCPFECEAYDNDWNFDYLKSRKAFEWKKYKR
jgi:hypothetical protein